MLTATFVAAGAGLSGAAFAGISGAGGGTPAGSTSGSGSVLGGNQGHMPAHAPVNVCGNAAAVLGDSAAGCEGAAAVQKSGGSVVRHSGGSAASAGGAMAGKPHTAPMRRLGAAQPVAGAVIPGLATLPVMSALAELPARASRAVSARRPSLPAGVHLPWASTVPATGRRPLGTAREGMTRAPGTHGKATVSQAASGGQAVLGALPGGAGAPDPTNIAASPAVSTMTADRTAIRDAMPGSTLAAHSAPGMGSASFYSLAIGSLMAGAVALKMAGRRIRDRTALRTRKRGVPGSWRDRGAGQSARALKPTK
jgi:hypothetical protein